MRFAPITDTRPRVQAQLSTDGNGNVKIECPNAGKKFAAEEISALVLRKLVDDSAKFLNDKARCRPGVYRFWFVAALCLVAALYTVLLLGPCIMSLVAFVSLLMEGDTYVERRNAKPAHA